MRELVIKSPACADTKLMFHAHDHGPLNGSDWQVTLRTRLWTQAGSGKCSVFDGNRLRTGTYVIVEESSYGLTLKDLNRLEKWVKEAKKQLKEWRKRK